MKTDWWKDAIVYQVYPRSFQDSNGDGIGDLPGIAMRLDYIRDLGANTLWLCPVYASPNADNGYDISDYRAIHPDFGTMEDFDRLLSEAHARGMRLIMDLVVNHTSDEHEWFRQSRSDADGKYGDFYIWRLGAEGRRPNAWKAWFGGAAWDWDEEREAYYLHLFDKKQPDLNWENPEVRAQVYDIMNWWFDKGIDGFRMDVISLISKPAPIPSDCGENPEPYCANGPRVHEFLKEMNRNSLSRYDCMTVGECPGVTIESAKDYAGFDRHELNMVIQFEHTSLTDDENGKWTRKRTYLPDLKRVFNTWQTELYGRAWNCLFWGNHDQPRAVSKFGSDLPEYRELSAKMLCVCLYFMQGTPFIYQGEELGMTNPGFTDISQYRDVESHNAYRELSEKYDERTALDMLRRISRDNARSPMQWHNGANAGFTAGKPWIDLGRDWREINAQNNAVDPASVYNFYRQALSIRSESDIVREGDFALIWPEDESIFAYVRTLGDRKLYVMCNFTSEAAYLPEEFSLKGRSVLLSNYEATGERIKSLRAYEAVVITE